MVGVAEVNPDDFKSINAAQMDAQLAVRFFVKERPDPDASIEAGRPIYRDVEYIEIRVPGQRDAQACRPATLRDKERFRDHYRRFKDRTAAPTSGTPLSEWPAISRSQAEELSFLNVKTLEDLVAVSDSNLSQLHGGFTLRRKAQEWLEQANGNKLLKEKQALEKRLADMEAKLDAMTAAPEPERAPPPEAFKSPSKEQCSTENVEEPEEASPAPRRRRRSAEGKKPTESVLDS